MTIAEQVDALVDRIVNEGEIVTLTHLFELKQPTALETVGQDEIAFVYADGSRFGTVLVDDDEWEEFNALRATLAAEGRTTEK